MPCFRELQQLIFHHILNNYWTAIMFRTCNAHCVELQQMRTTKIQFKKNINFLLEKEMSKEGK
jgi:hypothetical protein